MILAERVEQIRGAITAPIHGHQAEPGTRAEKPCSRLGIQAFRIGESLRRHRFPREMIGERVTGGGVDDLRDPEATDHLHHLLRGSRRRLGRHMLFHHVIVGSGDTARPGIAQPSIARFGVLQSDARSHPPSGPVSPIPPALLAWLREFKPLQ